MMYEPAGFDSMKDKKKTKQEVLWFCCTKQRPMRSLEMLLTSLLDPEEKQTRKCDDERAE